jgi:AraC-like DNA-binding protein
LYFSVKYAIIKQNKRQERDMNRGKTLFDLMAEGNLKITKLIKQYWRDNSFSYLESPRPDHGILLLSRGRVEFVCSYSTVKAFAGCLVYLPKGSRYRAEFFGEAEDYLISFDGDFVFAESAPTLIAEGVSSELFEGFSQFVESYYDGRGTSLGRKGEFYLLLDRLSSGINGAEEGERSVIARAKELLSAAEDLPISRIAKECCVSESSLRRLFAERVGTSPAKYRLESKIREAKYLLDSTDLSVKEIAERLNFFDSAHFCKLFLGRVGMTPKEYLKNRGL